MTNTCPKMGRVNHRKVCSSTSTKWMEMFIQEWELARKLEYGMSFQAGEPERQFLLPDLNLEQEFFAWEAASDEALANFEDALEKIA